MSSFARSRPKYLQNVKNCLKMISQKIKENEFSSQEIFNIFETNVSIIECLFELELVDYHQIKGKKNEIKLPLFVYFIPEIKDQSPQKYADSTKKGSYLSSVLGNLSTDDIKMIRQTGMSHIPLAKLIIEDDINSFIDYIASSNYDINGIVPRSIFESNFFLQFNNFSSGRPGTCPLKMIEYASFFGSLKIFKYLLLNKAKIDRFTAIYAICGGNYDIIHILENNRFQFTEDCLNAAIEFHRNDIFLYLHETCGIPFSFENVNYSITSNNFVSFSIIIKEIKNIIYGDGVCNRINIQLLISICGSRGNLAILEFVYKNLKKEDKSIVYNESDHGIMNNHIDIVKFYLSLDNFNPNNCKLYGKNDLHLACITGNIEIIKILIASGHFDINGTTKMHETPLFLAVKSNHLKVIEFLLKHYSHQKYEKNNCVHRNNTNVNDFGDNKVEENNAEDNNIEVISSNENNLSIGSKNQYIDINIPNYEQNTPFMEASAFGHTKVAKVLISYGKENIMLNKKNQQGLTALHLAALHRRHNIVKFLIDIPGIDLNARDKELNTPIFCAVKAAKIENLKIFLEKKGVDIYAKGKNVILLICVN